MMEPPWGKTTTKRCTCLYPDVPFHWCPNPAATGGFQLHMGNDVCLVCDGSIYPMSATQFAQFFQAMRRRRNYEAN